MIEEEAKTKWCPMVQVTSAQHMNDIEYGDNRGNGDESHNCIASDCMMWRYVGYEYINPENVPPTSRGTLEGYCGLAK